MKKNIWKFELPFSAANLTITVQVPKFADFLSLGLQGDTAVVWFCFSPSYAEDTEPRAFTACPTGFVGDFDFDPIYRGTLQYEDGFVGHIYEHRL